MRTSQLLAALVAVSTVSASVFDDVKAVADIGRMVMARQDSQSSSPSATAAPKSDESKSAQETASATKKDDDKASGSAQVTDSAKATGTGKDSGSGGGNRTQTFDARLPAGGISMITPSALGGANYYKIGDWVTLAWNYTSLSATPTAVDVLASCSANQGTYTLAVNQSVEATGKVLWDTGAYQATGTLPLLTETYTLIVYDADSSISATAQAGYLGTSNQFTFGMYSPQPYTPWTDYKCPTCSAAMSAYELSVLKLIFFTGGTTLASLFYFAWTFGIF